MLTPAADELSPDELVAATGKKRAATQAAALARLGVPFVFLGRAVKVARSVAQAHALLQPGSARPAGVDWSRVK